MPRPPSFSTLRISRRLVCSAGARPNSRLVSSAIPSITPSTRASSSMGCQSWFFSAPSCLSQSSAKPPTLMPTMPPPSASSTLSISNWRTMAPRLPPSAIRVAISRPRAPDRASSSPAMFTQPISSTIRTAAQVSSSSDANALRRPGLQRDDALLEVLHLAREGRVGVQRLAERSQLLARLRPTHARLQARDHFVVGSAALTLPAGAQGRPDVHRRGGAEIARHDADHRVLFAPQADGVAEHRRVAMEDALPEGVTQDGDRHALRERLPRG